VGHAQLQMGYSSTIWTNVIDQNGNVPEAFLIVGRGHNHGVYTTTGTANCGTAGSAGPGSPTIRTYRQLWQMHRPVRYAIVQDFSTILNKPASDYNHAFLRRIPGMLAAA